MIELQPEKVGSGSCCVFTIIGLSMGLGFGLPLLFAGESFTQGAEQLAFGCIGGGVTLLLVFIFGGMALKARAKKKVFEQSHLMASGNQLRIGDTISLQYTHPFKRNWNVEQFSIGLVLQESVTYTRGTDTYTDTHDHEIDVVGQTLQTVGDGQGISQTAQFRVPYGNPPSFAANRNRLKWYIVVKIRFAKKNAYEQRYEIQVAPVVAPQSSQPTVFGVS